MVLPTGVNLQVVKFKLLGWMYTYVVVQTLNTFFFVLLYVQWNLENAGESCSDSASRHDLSRAEQG